MHRREDTCDSANNFDGENFKARISSIFVIFAVSAIGSFLPILASKNSVFRVPGWVFFIVRYLGSGVIVATGFIHLVAEAHAALSDPCLGGVFDEYPWADGICLMGVFAMFVFDLFAHQHMENKIASRLMMEAEHYSGVEAAKAATDKIKALSEDNNELENKTHKDDAESLAASVQATEDIQKSYHQIINSFVLEFGIVFHSVFVGLSLAIAGEEFVALYIAIAFHQMFEGLGLGTRFALTPWPKNQQYMPWLLALAYSFTTPIAIAIGIGVRHSYPPGSRTALITTGVFDALCGGVLIYNSLVELMAYDFIHSTQLKGDGQPKRQLWAGVVCLAIGAAAMALIGKWA